MFNGIIGSIAMFGAVGLTLYSLGLYVRRYGGTVLRVGTQGAGGS